MQGNVLGQSGGGLKIDELIKEYKVASGGNVNAGDFVKYLNEYETETGNNTSIASGKNYGWIIKAILMSENTVFITHTNGSTSSDYNLYGIVCTINGNTITTGTDTLLSNYTNSGRYYSIAQLTSNRVFIIFTQYAYVMACTISGTTITKGTETLLSVSIQNQLHCVSLSSTKVFVIYNYSNSLYGFICTISGTTITKGTTVSFGCPTTPHVTSLESLYSNTVIIIGNYRRWKLIWSSVYDKWDNNNIRNSYYFELYECLYFTSIKIIR